MFITRSVRPLLLTQFLPAFFHDIELIRWDITK